MHRLSNWLWGCALAAMLSRLYAGEPPTNNYPSTETLIQGIAARAQDDARLEKELEASYRFTHTRTREEFNLKGKSKKREFEQEVHDPTVPEAKRTGSSHGSAKRVSPDEAPDRAYERKDVIITEDLLRRFEFTPLGRETVDGMPLLKVSFRPVSSGPPTKGLLERFISRVAGTVWLDEKDFTVVRASFYLTEKINVGAGVLGSVSSFDCWVERLKTAEGIWYTHEVDWHLTCREFLVNKIIEQREGWDDVRKVKLP